jgi:hypothetical protein
LESTRRLLGTEAISELIYIEKTGYGLHYFKNKPLEVFPLPGEVLKLISMPWKASYFLMRFHNASMRGNCTISDIST